jgi:hypothetical protein
VTRRRRRSDGRPRHRALGFVAVLAAVLAAYAAGSGALPGVPSGERAATPAASEKAARPTKKPVARATARPPAAPSAKPGRPAAATPRPTAKPSAKPTTPARPGVVVKISVIADTGVDRHETFHVHLTEPDDIAIARGLARGEELPSIPNGRIAAGTDANAGYSWHLDPNDFEWAELTMEVCDGLPSMVGPGFPSDRFCPWSSTVVSVEPA